MDNARKPVPVSLAIILFTEYVIMGRSQSLEPRLMVLCLVPPNYYLYVFPLP
jgi:hypothetical protein